TIGTRIEPLPETRREALAIVDLVGRDACLLALDFAANRELVTSGVLREYRFIHFATHGSLNSEHPELSGIALSLYDQQGNPQNGFVRVHDLFNLDLPAE